MSHDHHHHHHPDIAVTRGSAYIAGIVLNAVYVVVELGMGLSQHSMSLLADAWHNLSDVAALGLSLLAFRLAKLKPTSAFTYGYKKTTILAALANAVILLVTVGMLGIEAIHRLSHPQPVNGGVISIVSAIGIAVNAGSAFLFLKGSKQDLNTHGAFLHLLYDALVSAGVVLSGIVITYTGWYLLDGITSLVILVVIVVGTWSLLTRSLKMALDAVPGNLQKDAVEAEIRKIDGVRQVRHTHIWAMSTTETALTTHVELDDSLDFNTKLALIKHIKHELRHLDIHHATVELELCGEKMNDKENEEIA